MTDRADETSPQISARIAGFLYLIIIALGLFAEVVRERVLVSGDAAATARNILAHEQLYRLGFAAGLIVCVCGLPLTVIFYNFSGYLIFRSTFLPRILGVLFAIAGLCYLTNSFASFLSPALAAHLFPYILVPSFIGELSVCLWLLVMGVNVPKWKEKEAAFFGLRSNPNT